MKKTSETHPLRIDTVPVGSFGGLIGMTLCPGKRIASAISGEWERDLDADFAEIAEWGASVVVSLMEPHEFAMLGVPDFARHIPAGIEHLVLPIVDGGVPSGTWERAWAKAGPSLREKLALGGRILIHCRGGLGRTGIVAARLLVEFGEEPAAGHASRAQGAPRCDREPPPGRRTSCTSARSSRRCRGLPSRSTPKNRPDSAAACSPARPATPSAPRWSSWASTRSAPASGPPASATSSPMRARRAPSPTIPR